MNASRQFDEIATPNAVAAADHDHTFNELAIMGAEHHHIMTTEGDEGEGDGEEDDEASSIAVSTRKGPTSYHHMKTEVFEAADRDVHKIV